MRKLIVAFAALFAVVSAIHAGVGISVNIGINQPAAPPPPPPPPKGYYAPSDDDEDMYRDDLVMINKTTIGFWVLLPTGYRVLHCRTMMYDQKHDEWYYGPWHEDRNRVYSNYRRSPYFGLVFYDYMHKNYPNYCERRFSHYKDHKEWKKNHEKVNGRNRQDVHEKYRAETDGNNDDQHHDHDVDNDRDQGHGHKIDQ